MLRLHSRGVPTFQPTGWTVEAGRKCTVTFTGQSAPGRQLPAFCSDTPVIGPACRPASAGAPRGRCGRVGLADCLEGWAGAVLAGAAAWLPRPSAPTSPLP